MDFHLHEVILILFVTKNVEGPNLGQLRESITVEDQRCFIKVSVLIGTDKCEVTRLLSVGLGDKALRKTAVYKWYHHFSEGKRTWTEDLPCEGKPSEITSQENKEKIKKWILESEGAKTQDIAWELNLDEKQGYTLLEAVVHEK